MIKPFLTHRSTIAAAITASFLGLTLSACSPAEDQSDASTETTTEVVKLAPGAPGVEPTWAFSGKTGIGTSYEPYVNGQYQDQATNPVSKVWFSIAQGVLTETMFGLIHNAQLKELQFIITGNGFVDTEKDHTISTIEYLDTDETGRPLSLAYKIINKDIQGKYQIEKHIFTDPDRNSLMMKVTFTAFEAGITPHLYVNPHIDNSGANDIASVEGQTLVAHTSDANSTVMTIKTDVDFVAASAGFVGTSDGLVDLQDNGTLDWHYRTTSDTNQGGNVALTAQYPTLTKANDSLSFNLVIGFGQDKASSLATAQATLNSGYDAVKQAYLGDETHLGWKDYLASLAPLNNMSANTTDNGKLLYASALVLKAQEDKTHAGALIASLSNPWGDTVSATVGSTGYKAVWPRDFYQCAMAFLAMGDTQTPKVAFEYLKQVQVQQQTPGFIGTPGWFLQKTHVDGEIEWVGVQLDQTAMPIMLGWKLWQAGILNDAEISQWYQDMLKPAADFLVNGGKVKLGWNDTAINPPSTQQERWEEQAGFSPSTTAAIIAGLVAASDIAMLVKDEQASVYTDLARKLQHQLESTMVTTTGSLGKQTNDTSSAPYYVRISPNGDPNTTDKLLDNNGKPGLDQRMILDGGFLELVRYGVVDAQDPVIKNSVMLIDDQSLADNLRVKYEFSAKDGSTIPGYRRYGNDGYGEDTVTGLSYAEKGNTEDQRGRVWPFFTGERGHYELALAKANGTLSADTKQALINTYVQGMETFANQGLMLPEQAWDGVGNATRYDYKMGQGTNSATPLAWTHAEYIKLVRSMTDEQVWDFYPVVKQQLAR
ncbi:MULTISPECIES: glucan 1,4-alpha-glucosidase [Shewanella]|uniref:glucan 1,4-alpha-glucosidase n=1 Tax=Shewanella TaxID=22 RepID=UPI000CA8CAE7|nr:MULTISPECIES: glucan 1,4-alpha-glucosidase [Shewanella]NCQ43739.1 glucan 1,4-alpha-glucosidase [Shewanella frigidimarina]NCO70113.1 glucan 1,4-alpha-glucosidase [Shewanella vesiculosa]NCP35653.1 glucan 1,4-alpha-glucosidase [Shewanella vesiculosa]NCP68234.1 glucan 1,4-alpha-glucosidase [Shewanella vesiculosa]NCP72806.1 glucan 1,4-alpha-glucosidase [Shewanella vesiculosa]